MKKKKMLGQVMKHANDRPIKVKAVRMERDPEEEEREHARAGLRAAGFDEYCIFLLENMDAEEAYKFSTQLYSFKMFRRTELRRALIEDATSLIKTRLRNRLRKRISSLLYLKMRDEAID